MRQELFNTALILLVALNAPTYAQGLFGPKTDYAVGSRPMSVFIADLDGDGDNDLAAANGGSDNLSVLLNNGNGTFAPKVDYAAGFQALSVFCADLDGDGDNDVAAANHGFLDLFGRFSGSSVSVLLNNGDGTFAPKEDYATGDRPTSVFSADLDGDGNNDLAVANQGSFPAPSNVSVLLNNGNGTFAPKVDYCTGSFPTSVFSADVEGDGDNDLAVANGNSHNVSVLLNNRDGTFAPKVDYDAGRFPFSVFIADLDGDGDNDFAVAHSGGVWVLGKHYAAGDSPSSVFISDLDGDGDNDLAVANAGSNNVSVLLNLSATPATINE